MDNNGFPGGSDSKESSCNVGDLGSILRLGRSPGGGHGNPLRYSCLENPHGQRSLAVYSPWGSKESHGVAKSVCVTKQAHTHTHTHTHTHKTHTHTHMNNKGLSDHSGNSKGFRSHVPRMETNQKYFLLYPSSIRCQ